MPAVATEDQIALIGAGPSGLAGARALAQAGLPFQGFEAHSGLGGLWDIRNPRSAVYETAHLVSSKHRTAFAEFPMAAHVADYPGHRELLAYLQDYAEHFDLQRHFRFGTLVRRIEPVSERPDTRWRVTVDAGQGPQTAEYKGVVVANGILAEPLMPRFAGRFDGELLHSSAYKHPDQLRGKRVLVVGAGNSGCDIAVDAVHHAQYVDLSVRRGVHFVPKYLFGRPADTVGGRVQLPAWLKQRIDSRVLKWFTGDPRRFGFPAPDHRLYEAHPVVNTLVLHHLGQGDLHVRPDVARLDGRTVHFKDGSARDYDLLLAATGYKLHYPFLKAEWLNWQGPVPRLYLNIFPPHYRRLAVLGMVEAAGFGWQGRFEQAALVARYLQAQDEAPDTAAAFEARIRGPLPDLSGGYRYLKLERMAVYVHRETYQAAVRQAMQALGGALNRG